MKKTYNTKKNIDSKNSGYTLVELLAVIAILCLLVTIVIYTANGVINSARNKTYQVTINNIESNSKNYVLENIASGEWIDIQNTTNQYQCVTVQNLIDTGYFKSDVLESMVGRDIYVKSNDNIYLERDKNTKTVTKNFLLVGNRIDDYLSLCEDISTVSDIEFEVYPMGWSKKKDITIRYKLKNINGNVSNYKYNYVYLLDNGTEYKKLDDKVFNSVLATENFSVDKNGTLRAKIGEYDEELVVSKIDNKAPDGYITSTNNMANKQLVTLRMNDNNGSLISEYYFGQDNPNGDVEWIKIDPINEVIENREVNLDGTWYLGVKDLVGNMTVVSKEFYKTILNINTNHATLDVSEIISMEGNIITLPGVSSGVSEKPYYTFDGWYMTSSFGGDGLKSYEPTGNKTLYGKTIENKLTGGVVSISDNVRYGETLTATITEDTVPKADSYIYQWYMNNTKSTTGGVKIDGAIGSTLILNKEQVGKYIYVVVNAKKDNYRDTSFSTVTSDKVGKKDVIVTAKAQTITYGNSIVTNSDYVTSNGLISGDSISLVTLTPSRSDAGTGIITPSGVKIVNNSNEDVTSYYNISYKTGVLTIRRATTATIGNCNTLTYNGKEQTLAGGGDYVIYSDHLGIDAGVYTVTVTADSNHLFSDSALDGTLTCRINTKNVEVSWGSTSTFTYNGLWQGPSASGKTNISGEEIVIYRTRARNAGSYTSEASCDGVSGGRGKCSNYILTNDSKSFKINKKSIEVTWGSTTRFTYDGNEHAPTVSVSTGLDSEIMTLIRTLETEVGNHTSTASCYSVSGGQERCSNYSLTNTSKDFTITSPNYKVIYDANGGSGAPSSQNKIHDVTLKLSNTIPTRTGYTFSGWNTKSDGSGTNYSRGDSYTANAPLTLYAKWSIVSYTISWNNYGTIRGCSVWPCPDLMPTSYIYGKEFCIWDPEYKYGMIYYNLNGSGATRGKASEPITQSFDSWKISGISTSSAYGGETSASNKMTTNGGNYTYNCFKNLRSSSGTVTFTGNWVGVNKTFSTLSKPGYTCYWRTNSDCSGKSYTPGLPYTVNLGTDSRLDYYACCTKN